MVRISQAAKRLTALLLAAASLNACGSDLIYEYEWFDPSRFAAGSRIPLTDLFPGDWKHVCIVGPGSPSITAIEQRLPQYLHKIWIGYGRLQDAEFTTTLFKFVLLKEDGFKIYMQRQDDGEFRGQDPTCTEFLDHELRVEVPRYRNAPELRSLRIEKREADGR